MNKKHLVVTVPTALAAVFFASVVVLAVITTVGVYPGNLQDWQTQTTPGAQPSPAPTPSIDFVFGPATPPLGRGSAQLSVGSDGGASAQLRQPDFAGTALPNPNPDAAPAGNELNVLTYSTYVQFGGSGAQAPYLILNVDYNNDGTKDDELVFEPQYQNATDCSSNPQADVAAGQWQQWDALNGCWYSTSGVAGSGPGTSVKPLRTITAAQPNAKIVNVGGRGGLRVVAGLGGSVGGGSAADWSGFVGNVDALTIAASFDSDTGPNGSTYDFEPKAPPIPGSRGVVISEIRNSGPGTGGTDKPTCAGCAAPALPAGSGDEYVELYNTTDNDISVTDEVQGGDGAGWTLVRRGDTCVDPPVVIATIPNGTVIPARGHYLLAGPDYSLGSYPAGDGSSRTPHTSATPDQTYDGSISDDVDVGLFNTTDTTSFDLAHRLDAVGFNNGSGNTCDLLTEGSPLPNTRNSTQQYAFVRREPLTGGVQDTDNNAADFVEVSTDPQTNVGDNAAPVLGTPGPQNTSSPVSSNDLFGFDLTAPTLGRELPPNRERDNSPDSCAPLGTLRLRRSITNNSGTFISRLRFRVVDVTTVNSPDESEGMTQAILHVRSSSPETVTAVPGRGDVQVRGLRDEQEIFENETQCGGMNTSLSDDTVTLESPLAPGQTIDVVFLLGVEQTGHFRFYVNIEALETSTPLTEKGPPSRPVTAKKPIAMPGVTAPKPPGTSNTPAAPSHNAPSGSQGVTPPARPAITPGIWRKLSPDATPDTPPDAMPASKRTPRDSN
jgi:hypothetical protein